MDSQKTIENRQKRGRKIWTEEGDKSLIEIIKTKEKLSWNEIAEELSKEQGMIKSGKQCRERFRNYADPALEKCEWKSQEKLLFIILHRIYSHQWCNISKYLTQRSDIAIKNYFYSIVRKSLRCYKSGNVSQSLLKKPAKLYQIYNTLDLIRKEYLVEGNDGISPLHHKEKIILKLLTERKATREAVKLYQELLISKFSNFYSSGKLPVKVSINLKELNVQDSRIRELTSYEKIYNAAPLSQVLIVDVVVPAETMVAATSLSFVSSPAQTHQYTHTSPYSLPNSFNVSYPPTFKPYYCIPRTYLPTPQCMYINAPGVNQLFNSPYMQTQQLPQPSKVRLMEPERKMTNVSIIHSNL